MVSRFFDNVRDHSEIKLRILEKFLTPWAAKLGSIERTNSGVIWYIDGFAGPGTYGDGTEGSPLIGLREADQINTANRGYELACSFVENKRSNWQSLEDLCRPFRERGITANNRFGEFADVINDIHDQTFQSPMLLFVDPFGIKPIKYQQFKTLLERRRQIDLILNFSHRAVYRLATDYPDVVTGAIGSGEWQKKWRLTEDPGQRAEFVLEEFRQNLMTDGRFHNVLYYPIRRSINSSPIYHLVLASRHPDAFELWNDAISQEEMALSIKEYTGMLRQASFLPELDSESRAGILLKEIREFAEPLSEFTRQQIVLHFVEHYCGQFHTSDVKKAVGSLVESGKFKRLYLTGHGINSDPMTHV